MSWREVLGKGTVSVLGLGYLPVAPGSWGSLGAVGIALGAYLCVGGDRGWWAAVLAVLCVAAVAGCVGLGRWAVQAYQSADPRPVVLDEAAGQWLGLVGLPVASWPRVLIVLAVQFVLFRLADVIKPPPARRLERLPAGWGIVCDDLASGVYVNLIGQVLFGYLWAVS
ncbi:MAG: phosphatidylglycerophosphatase A [Phycisphaerae bacterium]